ncbi:hypothetical protein M23134_06613, partial [Microscilla marina ATCC 23134]
FWWSRAIQGVAHTFAFWLVLWVQTLWFEFSIFCIC